MSYSIVVVTWECADYLERLAESMNEHLVEDPQLVVVDNASSDDPHRAAECWHAQTTFIQLEKNVGFGKASNEGVRKADHDTVVLLNPDTKLLDRSLSALAEEARARNALVGPRLLNPDGTIQPSASGSPIGIWPWVNAVVPGAVMPEWIQARTEPWRLERRTQVAWLTGACIAAPRSVLLRLGPFDPKLELFSEDMDLGLRASRMGISSIFLPDVCRVVHYGDASVRKRFADHGRALAAANRRRVLERLFGTRSERRAWWSERVKLELRVRTKSALRRPAERDRSALEALRLARKSREC